MMAALEPLTEATSASFSTNIAVPVSGLTLGRTVNKSAATIQLPQTWVQVIMPMRCLLVKLLTLCLPRTIRFSFNHPIASSSLLPLLPPDPPWSAQE